MHRLFATIVEFHRESALHVKTSRDLAAFVSISCVIASKHKFADETRLSLYNGINVMLEFVSINAESAVSAGKALSVVVETHH